MTFFYKITATLLQKHIIKALHIEHLFYFEYKFINFLKRKKTFKVLFFKHQHAWKSTLHMQFLLLALQFLPIFYYTLYFEFFQQLLYVLELPFD